MREFTEHAKWIAHPVVVALGAKALLGVERLTKMANGMQVHMERAIRILKHNLITNFTKEIHIYKVLLIENIRLIYQLQ